jgi:hypothetical protein
LADTHEVFRIARGPNVWAPPDWANASPDGTFSNRWDDPEGHYRVVYASSQRLGCFVETLARFRVDPTLAAELATIAGADDFYPLGHISPDWFHDRNIGRALLHGNYADISSAEWVQKLRTKMLPYLKDLKLNDFDAADLQSSHNRKITQRVSRIVYEENYDGILYLSKHGNDLRNWAIFEPFKLTPHGQDPVRPGDPDFLKACELLSLTP